jgi:RHH-type transcriptional regulator, rel operon repressor / antitoxin RelB
MDETVEVTVRLPVALQRRVDTIAQALDHPRAWVIERAIESFVEIESIKRALAEADAGDFASDAEVDEVFGKWRHHSPNAGQMAADCASRP